MAANLVVENILYDIKVGDKIKLNGKITGSGIVKYIGPIANQPEYEIFYGIIFKKPIGDTNGKIKKKIYFKCKAKYGAFVQRTDIIYPFPIIFNEICDTTFHILSSTLFSYFDPVSIGNFCKINNGLCKIIFNIDENYSLTWKKQWRLFISPKSENDNFSKRWQRLYSLYKSTIFGGAYQHQEIAFGVWKIANLKEKQAVSNSDKAMAIQRALLPIISMTDYGGSESERHLQTNPCEGSLRFDAMIKKIKLKQSYAKQIKTEKDASIKIGTSVCGTIYYRHIKCYDDIFANKVKGARPFHRKYLNRKPLKAFKQCLKEFLMPSFLELSVKQWFVLNVEKRPCYEDSKPHSYIVGWISTKKLIVVGGAYGSYKWEVMQSTPCDATYSDGDYWSNSS